MKYTKLVRAEATVSIPMSDYIELLEERFKTAPQDWHSEAADSLWPQYIELIEDAGPGQNAAPSYVVDNYLINGEFISKKDWAESYPESYKEYQGNWEQFCQDMAIIYNELYTLI